MSDYPDDLTEWAYYDEILGPPPDDSRINDLDPNARWVGVDKANVQRMAENWEIYPEWWKWSQPREYGDNDPSDPFENWDEDNFKGE